MGYDGYTENLGYCENNSIIIFKVYKELTGELINMKGDIPEWITQNNFVIELLSEDLNLPETYSLSHPYPNPFNPITNINFSIPYESHVKIIIYDIQGRLVEEILNDVMNPGIHNIKWSANNYASGIYFIKMFSDNFSSIQKVTLLK